MKPGSPISEAVWLAHDFLSLRFVTDRCTCEDKTANPPSAHWVPTGVWSPSRSCVPAPNGLLILYRLRNMFGDADLPMLLLWSRRNKKLLLPPVHAHAVAICQSTDNLSSSTSPPRKQEPGLLGQGAGPSSLRSGPGGTRTPQSSPYLHHNGYLGFRIPEEDTEVAVVAIVEIV